ncbi:hypothetical protein SNEBB_006639 [Seison nebaliae]|nr:hypothetical protein SNEBB_006639 [Seison nebaliae]
MNDHSNCTTIINELIDVMDENLMIDNKYVIDFTNLFPSDEVKEKNLNFFKQSISKSNSETFILIGTRIEVDGSQFKIISSIKSENELSDIKSQLVLLSKELNVDYLPIVDGSIKLMTEFTSKKNRNVDPNLHHNLMENLKFSDLEKTEYQLPLLIRKRMKTDDFFEVRIGVVGNVDAGKSTMLGVLTHCVLDDGRGLARQCLFRHKHEIETGRTSSVGYDILGYSSTGCIVNRIIEQQSTHDWNYICKNSSKIITFIDLAGHEKYLKTTVFGLTSHQPDYCMLMIGANSGIIGMTKEHLGLALALRLRIFVVITKIDMCPEDIRVNTITYLEKMLKSSGCKKRPVVIQKLQDVIFAAENIQNNDKICPIFQISNLNGNQVDFLRLFLNLIPPLHVPQTRKPTEFVIDETYTVTGVGTVVTGTVFQGQISVNDHLWLGPDKLGSFRQVQIRSIHRKRMLVDRTEAVQSSCLALKKIRRNEVRKGMVMLEKEPTFPEIIPNDQILMRSIIQGIWEFDAEILILHHPTTIAVKYQAVIHCGAIRQTATIVHIEKIKKNRKNEVTTSMKNMEDDDDVRIRTGDKAIITFRFINRPEYIKIGQTVVFREGRTKAVGSVKNIYNYLTKKLHSASRMTSYQRTIGRKLGNKKTNIQKRRQKNEMDKKVEEHK